mgnify:FL=1
MGLKLKEKKALNEFIDNKIKSGYGIVFDFKVQKDKTLKTQISKENYSVANQYIKKHAEKTWWRQSVGKPQYKMIRKTKWIRM